MAGVCQCKEHFRNLLFWRFGYVAHEQKPNICCTAAEVSSHVDITVEGVLHTITCVELRSVKLLQHCFCHKCHLAVTVDVSTYMPIMKWYKKLRETKLVTNDWSTCQAYSVLGNPSNMLVWS